MNANSENLEGTFSDCLAEIERYLEEHQDDRTLLREVRAAMAAFVSGNGRAEADIRAILHKRLNEGALRRETFQLVSEMLDRVVSEHVETSPNVSAPDADGKDTFTDTTVLPVDSLPAQDEEGRLQVGSVLRDRFLLQERVAGGSMGVVYKALDRRLAEASGVEPWVAIKVLSPRLAHNADALRALQQEAAKGRCLSHPNIVRFLDLDRDDDTFFIVMEWLQGRSLAHILDDSRDNAIDIDTALDIVRQVARALDYAHRCGVVHADVKPGNIMITPSGEVKLYDFGVARIRQKRRHGDPEFDPGVLDAKTPAYSSMQVLTGEEPTPSDDVFSLACLMYRLVAGYRVFGPRNAAEAAEAGMEPQRPQGLDQQQWAALRKALSYARVARFKTPAEFIEALDGGKTVSTEPDVGLPIDAEDLGRKSPWRFAMIVVIIAAATAVVTQTDLLRLIERSPDETADPGAAAVPDETGSAEPEAHADPSAEVTPPEDAGLPAEAPAPIDFSELPPPDLLVTLAAAGAPRNEFVLTLREDSGDATIDLVRATDLAETLVVKLDEIGYSGNRSPWEAGQYLIADEGVVTFPAGGTRARTTISMPSDPLREPDRQVTLLVRDIDTPTVEYAAITLNLEDDDQRAFEAGLQPNTVAFAVSQVSVREQDPAVQIDVLRFKPDDSPLEINYVVRDVNATDGEDYFAPAYTTVAFAPGQRTARILIPMVQDSEVEPDEAFMLELVTDSPNTQPDIFLRIAVMIRDDDF